MVEWDGLAFWDVDKEAFLFSFFFSEMCSLCDAVPYDV